MAREGPERLPDRGTSLPTLGQRGEGWVVLQLAVLASIAAAGLLGPDWFPAASRWRQLGAATIGLLGAPLLLGGALRLGRQLTPLPRPVEGGALKDRGVYALVRHPMYGGVLLLCLAWALLTSPIALVPVGLGAAFLEAKRRLEEAWLMEHRPGYGAYRSRVRWRLVPFVW
jgi:protein-S-isoprenylcysteine O-methyltransferase Ste14